MVVLEAVEISKTYKKNIFKNSIENMVLKNINLKIKKNDFIAIMGKSGSGKTTLLKILGTLEEASSGKLVIDGRSLYSYKLEEISKIRRKKIGFIFQDFYLMESLTLEENIMLPMILDNKPMDEIKKVVINLAKQFEVQSLLNKYPYEISGGEKQRIAICRALSNNPDIILADEPTGNLDSVNSKIVIECLEKVNKELDKAVIIVTHDAVIASHCKKVLFLKDGIVIDSYEDKGKEMLYNMIVKKMTYI